MHSCGEASDGRNEETSNETPNDLLRGQPSMVGLDGSVLDGACPGVHFGYEPATKADFRVIHPAQAKVVRRVFELGISLSAEETAHVLATERRPGRAKQHGRRGRSGTA
jgi:hypothetical protein